MQIVNFGGAFSDLAMPNLKGADYAPFLATNEQGADETLRQLAYMPVVGEGNVVVGVGGSFSFNLAAFTGLRAAQSRNIDGLVIIDSSFPVVALARVKLSIIKANASRVDALKKYISYIVDNYASYFAADKHPLKCAMGHLHSLQREVTRGASLFSNGYAYGNVRALVLRDRVAVVLQSLEEGLRPVADRIHSLGLRTHLYYGSNVNDPVWKFVSNRTKYCDGVKRLTEGNPAALILDAVAIETTGKRLGWQCLQRANPVVILDPPPLIPLRGIGRYLTPELHNRCLVSVTLRAFLGADILRLRGVSRGYRNTSYKPTMQMANVTEKPKRPEKGG